MVAITTFYEFSLQSGSVTKMSWSRNGRFLGIPSESGSVVIFDFEARQTVRILGHHADCVTAIAWDRKDESILTGALDGSVGLWQVSTGKRAPFSVQGHNTPVHTVEW